MLASALPSPRAALTTSLLHVLRASSQFTVFLKAMKAADLTATMAASGPLTVLAPTDEAFGRFPRSTLTRLLRPDHQALLRTVLLFHIIPASITSKQWADAKLRVPTMQGGPLSLDGTLERDVLVVNRCRVVQRDLLASNGVVHAIDSVLWPQMGDASALTRRDKT